MPRNLYRGFSTLNRTSTFRVIDVELIKQDLINHFSTRKGERLMYPNFGTTIWDMLYDPFDEQTKRQVNEEVVRVVQHDPRVIANSISVTEFEHGLQVEMTITVKETDETSTMTLQFDRDSAV